MGYPWLAEALRSADFDQVEVVGLGLQGPGFDAGNGAHSGVEWSRSLDAEQRGRLRALIGALPGGTSARCHDPPFGLRFGTGPGELRVTICFRCNNSYVAGTLAVFDATSAQARDLLAFLRGLAPAEWQSPE